MHAPCAHVLVVRAKLIAYDNVQMQERSSRNRIDPVTIGRRHLGDSKSAKVRRNNTFDSPVE